MSIYGNTEIEIITQIEGKVMLPVYNINRKIAELERTFSEYAGKKLDDYGKGQLQGIFEEVHLHMAKLADVFEEMQNEIERLKKIK
jgi:hypothetical protein